MAFAEIRSLDLARYDSSLPLQCLLAVYGTFPTDAKLVVSAEGLDLTEKNQMDRFITGCAQNFPSHRARRVNSSA